MAQNQFSMENAIKIGVYTEQGELVGYKSDSFWTLSKTYAKPHHLDKAGNIPEHLIKNFNSILSRSKFASPEVAITGIISAANREAFHSNFETRLIGYSPLEGDTMPTFTHRIFETEVQPLDDGDKQRLAGGEVSDES